MDKQLNLKIKLHKLILPILIALRPFSSWVQKKSYQLEALHLNQKLFASVNDIPSDEIERVNHTIRVFCSKNDIDPDYGLGHSLRLILSKNWVSEIISNTEKRLVAIDLGTESISTFLWKKWFPNIQWHNTNFDLRFPWNLPDSFADIIVCTEVIEHLPDQPNAIYNEGFGKFGLKALLNEAFRVLKGGGYLFVTSPNASSMLHVKAILEKRPPWFFDLHIREYTLDEVCFEINKAGFTILRARDVHCMSTKLYSDFVSMFELLLLSGYPTEGRGDDLFILAQKPQQE
jgi:SAM-dependent methyltransferase